MRAALLWVCVTALGLGSVACRPGHDADRGNTETPSALRLGIDRWPGFYPALLAEELGFFREHGVEVDVRIPTHSDRMVAEFAAGRYDAAAVAIGDVINLLEANPDVRLVLVSDESEGADVLLADPSIRSVDQLRGRRIGTHLGGFGEVFIRRMLELHGIGPGEVTLINVDGQYVAQQIQRGTIAAGNTWVPWVQPGLDLGQHAIFTSRETPDLILDGVVVRGEVLRNSVRRQQAAAMVGAWLDASAWWRAHPDKGRRRLARRLDLKVEDVGFDGVRLLDARDNRRLLSLASPETSAASTIRYLVDFYVRRGTLSRAIDPGDVVDSSLIPRGDP